MDRARQFRRNSVGRGRNFGVADRVRLFIDRQNYEKRNFRRIIAVSSLVKRELMKWYGLRDRDVVVIPNGVNTGEFNLQRREQYRPSMRAITGVHDDQIVILFAGNEFGRKGLDVTVRALRTLQKYRVLLFVCGSDRPDPYLSLAQRIGVGTQIRFFGHCDQMVKYYAAADILVLPSLHEAFGMVITEAMACGLPVVVSREAGAAEDIIRDGHDGLLLADPGEEGQLVRTIRLLVEDRNLAQRLGMEAHKRVGVLGWDSCTRRVAEVYAEVLRKKAGSRDNPHDH
jgi:UDP-glucose:(heptosyl)LPS alpha-1,3-glucosyltransferase